jgi:hypothetical protein
MKEMVKLPFVGRDRRLFFNKALCELQMGKFDDCLRTCKNYRRPIKELLASYEETKKSIDPRLQLDLAKITEKRDFGLAVWQS